jgi:putrescine aminotransferase
VELFDEAGRRYLDFTAGYGSLNLGHNPSEVLEAVARARSLPAVMLVGYNPLMGAVASNLARLLPGGLDVTSFGNGGAEAVETALRTAMAATGKRRLLSCDGAYHGLSLGAMSVCGADKYCEAVGRFTEHCQRVPFGDLEALEAALRKDDVAAFIVEPVQGEGGAVVPPQGYLKGAEEACRRHGTLLIVDEIQTGFGRTGRMFAVEHEGVEPDIITLSKSMGSGVVPVSVSVTRRDIWDRAFGSRDRFDMVVSTFGGNPAACAAALKTMEVMVRDRVPERAAELGGYARRRLEEVASRHGSVRRVQGKGLLLGLSLGKEDGRGAGNMPAMVISRLLNKHGIATSYYDLDPDVVRFEPPLIATREHLDEAVAALDETLGKGALGLGLSFGASAMSRTLSRK